MKKHTALTFAFGAASAAIVAIVCLATPSLRAAQNNPPAGGTGLVVERKLIDGELIGKLVAQLQKTPGCLGVDAGQFRGGKRAIFAWFRDRDSAKAFYYSDVHQDAIERSHYEGGSGKPMAGITNADGPIMVVASASEGPVDPAHPEAGPTLSLSIEMYGVLPGGVHIGSGGLAPEPFVEAAKAFTAAKAAAAAQASDPHAPPPASK